ncbi:MAG: polysaccharide biosynthesis protein [Lactobacillus sp.]|nr:polysaccharide biosynthesis protein [Lactobacillus sp.]
MDKKNSADSQAQLLKGSAWMTFGSIASRILGAIYIIPWYAWMGPFGNVANALTAKSYNIYSLFLMISTAGIPGAVAKQIAKYNALEDYQTSRRLFKQGLMLMAGLGIASSVLMAVAAPILSGNDPRQIPVIRSLAFAVLIIPIMSIFRGYFQGFNNMKPSAMSQFFEQVARVAWMLLTAYIIMKVQHGNYIHAVTQSNLAAFVGALFGLVLLVWYYRKQNRELGINYTTTETTSTSWNLIFEIISQSIPFIVIDSGITLYQLVDQYTFHPILATVVRANFDQIESWYALFGLNANKLIMIVVSLSTAMAVTAIPLLSGAHARKDYRDIARQIESTIELFTFVMIPSSFGMAAIAKPLYSVFYGPDPLGTSVLVLSAVTAVTLGLFTVLLAIQQGLSENNLAIKYLLIGLIVKILIQYPCVITFKIFGPLISTNLAMIVTIAISLIHLRVRYHFNADRTSRRVLGVTIFSMIMFLFTKLALFVMELFLRHPGRMMSLIEVIICAGVGGLVFTFLVVKTELAFAIMGNRIRRITDKLPF